MEENKLDAVQTAEEQAETQQAPAAPQDAQGESQGGGESPAAPQEGQRSGRR